MSRLIRAAARLIHVVGWALYVAGWIALLGGLLWMIWLPMISDVHNIMLPLAVAWTGCIVGGIGAWWKEGGLK